MTKVKLLVSRAGFGKAGDVVEYSADVAEDHANRGLVKILTDDEADEESATSDSPATASKASRRKPSGDRKPTE